MTRFSATTRTRPVRADSHPLEENIVMKVLVVLTSHDRLGGTGRATGF
ncbi:hypothetical protein [Streptomyces sp. NPDC001665]